MSAIREKRTGDRQIFKNPAILFVNLLMAGIVILFAGLAYGYIFNIGSNWLEFKLPKVFWLSTVCIIAVSYFLKQALSNYDTERPHALKRALILSFVFSILFVVCQVLGWEDVRAQGIMLDTSPSGSYLYILTGLHVLHVAAGVIFLIVAIFRSFINTADELRSLLFFIDDGKRTRLKLMNTYWHTIDLLWIFIFIIFLFHHA